MTKKNKKDYPIPLLKTLQEVNSIKNLYYKRVSNTDNLLLFHDKDPESNFFYAVTGFTINKERKISLNVSFHPRSKDIIEIHESIIDLNLLLPSLTNWSNVLEEYDKIEIFNDPIIKQYQEEFISQFELNDIDADLKTYDFKTQIVIDKYLDFCQKGLLEIKTQRNLVELQLAIEEVDFLKNNQTNLTKRQVAESLSKIWAYTRKIGLKTFNVLFDKFIELGFDYILKRIGG